MEIGLPTNVKHVSHMGYTEEGGFQFDEQPMPLEWKKLFRAAGVKRKDLENKETAKLIVDTITANMTPEELARLPPLPGVTERVEAAQARRDVQARRAEQAKLMMAMLENGGDAAKGMEVMMMQGGEAKPPPPPSSSTLPPGAPPPPPGALKPQLPKTDAGGRTLKPVGAAAAAEAKETDKAARAKQLRKAAAAPAAAKPANAAEATALHKAAFNELKTMHTLPPGWQMVTDEASGRKYYYHSATGVTQWEAPKAAEPKEKKGKDGGVDAASALLVSVDAWLTEIGHEELQPIFEENGIELLADLRALDRSDLEVFGFDGATADQVWAELEKLPQADEVVIETIRSEVSGEVSGEVSERDGEGKPKRAALLADIQRNGTMTKARMLRHVPDAEKNLSRKDSTAQVLADIRTRPMLKSVPKEQRGTHKRMSAADPALQGLAGMLATAMTTRRAHVGNAEDDDDDDGWDSD